jgi:hypothetical protein
MRSQNTEKTSKSWLEKWIKSKWHSLKRADEKMATLQIVKQTSTILKLKAKEYNRSSLAPGIMSFLIGLVIMNVGEAKTLRCHRVESTEVTCKLTNSRLIGEHIIPILSKDIQGTDVQVLQDDGSTKYRLIILTRNSKIPVTKWNTYEKEVYSDLATFRAFLKNPEQKSLNWKTGSRYSSYFWGGIVVLFGSLLIRSALKPTLKIICIFNKSSGQFYLKRSNIYFNEYKVYKELLTKKQMLQEIKEAIVVQKNNEYEDNLYIYETKLILISGEEILLDTSDIASNHYEISKSINQFLGVSDSVR